MRFEYFIGWRYMLARSQVKFISVISLISISGVAVGVMSLIVVISVMNGFDRDLRERILGTKSHMVINDFYGITNYMELAKEIEREPNVVAAAPSVIGQGMLKYYNAALGVVAKGLDPNMEDRVTRLRENIVAGSDELLVEDVQKAQARVTDPSRTVETVPIGEIKPHYSGIILGKEVAKQLFGLTTPPEDNHKEIEKEMLRSVIGKRLKFISFAEEDTPAGRVPRTETLEVAGVFDSGLYDYDMSLVFLALPTAQRLYDRKDKAMQIEMRLKDLNKVDETAVLLQQRLQDRFDRLYGFVTWKEMNSVFFRALEIEKLAMFVILVLIVLVAAFNIASTLIMVVMEKTKEIGILMSMGAKPGSIMRIFLFEGGVVASVGTLLGSIAGVLICLFLRVYEIKMPGGGNIYYIERLPVQMLASDFIIIIGTTILVSLLAAIYPAWQASRLVPTEALRYE